MAEVDMDIDLELQLEERLDDRVIVSLWLAPRGSAPARVEGAALQLTDAAGEELCPRHLLPVAGEVSGSVTLTVELRAGGRVPEGARVVASAWAGTGEARASCPAEPYVSLRDHMRGGRIGLPREDDVLLTPLSDRGRERLERLVPWVAQPLRRPDVTGVIEAREPSPSARDLAEEHNLDPATASWLEGLLEEPDER